MGYYSKCGGRVMQWAFAEQVRLGRGESDLSAFKVIYRPYSLPTFESSHPLAIDIRDSVVDVMLQFI